MTIKKNVGTRTRPIVRTPEQQRKHRAEQAARAILAGRKYEENWDRIGRCFADFASAEQATGWAHNMGLATVPLHLLDAAFPPAPEQEPVAEEPSPADVGALLALAEMPNDPPAGEPAA